MISFTLGKKSPIMPKTKKSIPILLNKPNPSVNTETIMCQKKAWPSQKVLYI